MEQRGSKMPTFRAALDHYADERARHGKDSAEAKAAWQEVDSRLRDLREQGTPVITGRLLTREQVKQRYGFSTTTLYRLIKCQDFPAPIQISPNRVGWLEDECELWLSKRLAERDRGPRDLRRNVLRSLEVRAQRKAVSHDPPS
jgi:prophage regulatory protein